MPGSLGRLEGAARVESVHIFGDGIGLAGKIILDGA